MHRLMLISVPVFSALMIGACAKSPRAIEPADISHVRYQNYSCQQLATVYRQTNSRLSKAKDIQNRAHKTDVLGVMLVGLPVSRITGDNIAGDVATLKGRKLALETAATGRGCGSAM